MKKGEAMRKVSAMLLLCISLAAAGCAGEKEPQDMQNVSTQILQQETAQEENTQAETGETTAESPETIVQAQPETSQEPEETMADEEPEEDEPELPEEKLTADNGKMRKNLTAAKVAKEMGVGLNLGNTMEAYWEDKGNSTSHAQFIGANKPSNYETCWGARVTTQEIIDGMKAEGFNTVRIPVYWGNMMKDDKSFRVQETYLERVKEIVDYCRWNDMYVVINMHHYDEFLIKNLSREEALAAVETVWKQVAEYFKDYSDYLVFEGFNENVGSYREQDKLNVTQTYDYANALNQIFVDTVRATGGNNENRILIASGFWTNIDKTTNGKFKMPEDTAKDKLMISVHYIDNSSYWSNTVGGKSWISYATGQCKLLKMAFTDKGIPVFVGECTAIYGKDHISKDAEYTTSSECLSVILNMAADYGFVPVIWDTDGDFYNRGTCKLNENADKDVIVNVADKIAQR